jgi:hypothetical protein
MRRVTGDVVDHATTLDQHHAAFKAAVRARRWAGHQTVTFNGVVFASDDTATLRLTAAITVRQTAQALGLEATDATAGWEALDGTYVQMTLNDLRQLLLTGGAKIQACFDRQTALIGEGAGAETAAAFAAIDINTGWPD